MHIHPLSYSSFSVTEGIVYPLNCNFYVNIRYQFPYKPPAIPTTEKAGKVFSWIGVDQGVFPRWKNPGEEYNFAGVYRKFLSIDDPEKNYVISFLGVASCLDLYLNGEAVSDGVREAAFLAVDRLFELGIKPYSDRELLAMRHRSDEKRTGTYVTIQAFQQGIGTGACEPAVAPEFQYPAKRDYELKFLIQWKDL